MQLSIEDIYRETRLAYYVHINGTDYCFLKEEVSRDGTTLTVPEITPETGKSEKIIPAEMARQKRDNFRLEDIARYWGVNVSTVRKILLRRNIVIERAVKS